MGGGGGGNRSYSSYKRDIERAKETVDRAEYKGELGEYLAQKLKQFNDRDVGLINQRIDELCQAIEAREDTIRMTYSGSVSKHTFVDGLSDVDVLMPVNATEFDGDSPEAIKRSIADRIKDSIVTDVEVDIGRLAVTIRYPDDMEIQVLPAVRTDDGMKIPNRNGDRWSEIDPKGFTKALSKANEALGMKLVPTIKMVKSINSTLPKQAQLSGYHIESLAIEAFKSYEGERTAEAMCRHFFSTAKGLVQTPIKDKTGQSLHVDQYLGPRGSKERKVTHAVLDRIDRRLKLADTSADLSRWQEFFE